MKTNILAVLLLIAINVAAQNRNEPKIPSLGEIAPSFDANSTTGKIKYPENYYNKWRIILSHPGAFTPVCTSEIIELAYMQEEFKNLKTEIIIISTDGVNSNLEWIKSMEEMLYNDRKTPKINFPIISDVGLEISRKYGMQHSNISNTKNVRGVFIIDPDNRIRVIQFYPLNIGRSFNELKRVLIALQEADKRNVLTPANWNPGDDFLLNAPSSQAEFERIKNNKKLNEYYLAWYMWFRKN